MMCFAAFAKSCVVVGSDGVNHINIHFVMLSQSQTSFYYLLRVVALVGGVEMVIARKDLLFDVCYYFLLYHGSY